MTRKSDKRQSTATRKAPYSSYREPQFGSGRIMLSVRIKEHLVQALKEYCLARRRPVQSLVEEMVEDFLEKEAPKGEAEKLRKARAKRSKADDIQRQIAGLQASLDELRE